MFIGHANRLYMNVIKLDAFFTHARKLPTVPNQTKLATDADIVKIYHFLSLKLILKERNSTVKINDDLSVSFFSVSS